MSWARIVYLSSQVSGSNFVIWTFRTSLNASDAEERRTSIREVKILLVFLCDEVELIERQRPRAELTVPI